MYNKVFPEFLMICFEAYIVENNPISVYIGLNRCIYYEYKVTCIPNQVYMYKFQLFKKFFKNFARYSVSCTLARLSKLYN